MRAAFRLRTFQSKRLAFQKNPPNCFFQGVTFLLLFLIFAQFTYRQLKRLNLGSTYVFQSRISSNFNLKCFGLEQQKIKKPTFQNSRKYFQVFVWMFNLNVQLFLFINNILFLGKLTFVKPNLNLKFRKIRTSGTDQIPWSFKIISTNENRAFKISDNVDQSKWDFKIWDNFDQSSEAFFEILFISTNLNWFFKNCFFRLIKIWLRKFKDNFDQSKWGKIWENLTDEIKIWNSDNS